MGKEFNCIVYLSPFTRCVVLYQLENVAPLSAQQNQWNDPLQGVAKLPQTQLPRIDEYKWDSFSSLHAPLAQGLLKCRKVEWNLVACEHMCFEHFPMGPRKLFVSMSKFAIGGLSWPNVQSKNLRNKFGGWLQTKKYYRIIYVVAPGVC